MFERIDWLIRTGDPVSVGRAIELRVKLEAADEAAGKSAHDYDTGRLDNWRAEWRLLRDMMLRDHGASIWVLVKKDSGVSLSRAPLLHDLHWKIMRETHGPQIWQAELAKHSTTMQADMAELLGSPGWQLNTRREIWAEIDREPLAPIDPKAIDEATVQKAWPVNTGNGHVSAH
jgi:hypothetical protein